MASLAATVLTMGRHIPHGSWIIWTIFQVSSEDAGASLIKGALRIIGTLIGGLLPSSFPSAPASPVEVSILTHFSREVAIRRNVLGHVERLSRRVLRGT